MIQEGQIVVFAFPQTDRSAGKLRPALVLRGCPGAHGDWLICMISSQLRHAILGIDEVIRETDGDFALTGLRSSSVVRVTRLAVVAHDILQGRIGAIGDQRLSRIRRQIADWITGTPSVVRPGPTSSTEPTSSATCDQKSFPP